MKRSVKNVAVSVHTRLLQRARDEGRAFNELLQLYGMERLLMPVMEALRSRSPIPGQWPRGGPGWDELGAGRAERSP